MKIRLANLKRPPRSSPESWGDLSLGSQARAAPALEASVGERRLVGLALLGAATSECKRGASERASGTHARGTGSPTMAELARAEAQARAQPTTLHPYSKTSSPPEETGCEARLLTLLELTTAQHKTQGPTRGGAGRGRAEISRLAAQCFQSRQSPWPGAAEIHFASPEHSRSQQQQQQQQGDAPPELAKSERES